MRDGVRHVRPAVVGEWHELRVRRRDGNVGTAPVVHDVRALVPQAGTGRAVLERLPLCARIELRSNTCCELPANPAGPSPVAGPLYAMVLLSIVTNTANELYSTAGFPTTLRLTVLFTSRRALKAATDGVVVLRPP